MDTEAWEEKACGRIGEPDSALGEKTSSMKGERKVLATAALHELAGKPTYPFTSLFCCKLLKRGL